MATTDTRPKSSKFSMKTLQNFLSFSSIFGSRISKNEVNLAIKHICLLRKQKEAVVKRMRNYVAIQLNSSKENTQCFDTAMLWVECVIRENDEIIANEIVANYCDILAKRINLIEGQRACPSDMIAVISSLIYAAERCSEVSELVRFRKIFKKKYGFQFIYSAENLLPHSCVSAELIARLSKSKPTDEMKLRILKEIANEYNVDWGAIEISQELKNSRKDVAEAPHELLSPTSLGQLACETAENETKSQEVLVASTIDEHHSQDAEGAENPNLDMIISKVDDEEIEISQELKNNGKDVAEAPHELVSPTSLGQLACETAENETNDSGASVNETKSQEEVLVDEHHAEGAENANLDMRISKVDNEEIEINSHQPDNSHNKSPQLEIQGYCEEDGKIVKPKSSMVKRLKRKYNPHLCRLYRKFCVHLHPSKLMIR